MSCLLRKRFEWTRCPGWLQLHKCSTDLFLVQSCDKLSWQGSLQLVDHKKALGSISQLVHQAPELPVLFIHSEPANDPLPKRNNAQQCFSEGWFISFMRAFLWCCSLLDNQSLQHQSSQSCAISSPWLLHPSLPHQPHQCSPNLGLTTGRQFTKDRQCHLRVYDVPWRQKSAGWIAYSLTEFTKQRKNWKG